MIEIVYKENTKGTEQGRKLNLPRNVRQIGEPEANRKIYIEDYVITYLKKMVKESVLDSNAAILLGSLDHMEGIPYLFIKSAIGIKELDDYSKGIPFTDEVWTEIYGTIKEYFAGQDVLGWFLSMPRYSMDLNAGLLKTHINQFGGADKVLMVEELEDGEEDFYVYENGRLVRQRGYYIFYDRNASMQRYMVDTGTGESIEERDNFEDRAARSFRTLVREKKDLSGQKRVMTFLYTASTFLVMVVLVIGITLINNYEKMEGLELTLSEISRSLDQQEEQIAVNGEPLIAAMEEENIEAKEEKELQSQEQGEEQVIQEPVETQELLPQESGEENQEPQEIQPQVSEEPSVPEEPSETALSQNIIFIPESYTVQQGDTLLKISRKIYGQDNKIDDICNLNNIKDMNHILVGQKLLLP